MCGISLTLPPALLLELRQCKDTFNCAPLGADFHSKDVVKATLKASVKADWIKDSRPRDEVYAIRFYILDSSKVLQLLNEKH